MHIDGWIRRWEIRKTSHMHVLPLQYHHLLDIEGIVIKYVKYVTSVRVSKDLHFQISCLYLILGQTDSKILRDS